jgi:hypothetical protein
MGVLVLFPTHPLFTQFKTPACGLCHMPIEPGGEVETEDLGDSQEVYMHKVCYDKYMEGTE